MSRAAVVVVAGVIGALFSVSASGAGSPAVPVARCPTTLGVQQPLPKAPSVLHPSLTAVRASALEGYSNGYLTVLAPRGWRCRGQIGADGSGSLFVTPAGVAKPTQPAVTVEYGDTPGVSADLVCSLFAAARKQLPVAPCPVTKPAREAVVVLDTSTVAFQDPPGVHGDGLPSGGSDPANGVMMFTPSNTHHDGYSLTETCTLPASSKAKCTAILDNTYRAG